MIFMAFRHRDQYSNKQKAFLLPILALGYFLISKLSLSFFFGGSESCEYYIPFGLAFLVYFNFGRWVWISILAASYFLDHSIVIAFANSIGPLVAAEILFGIKNFRTDIARIRDICIFILIAVVLGPFISASIKFIGFKFVGNWVGWFFGNATGVLISAPFFLVFFSKRWKRPSLKKSIEGMLLMISFVVSSIYIFKSNGMYSDLIYPFGLWAVVRFGQLGMMGMVLILGGVSIPIVIYIMQTHLGLGSADITALIHRMQLTLGVATLSGMILSALLESERRNIKLKLSESKQFRDELMDSLQDGFYVLDADGIQTDVNDSFLQMTGFSRNELIGVRPPFPFWPPEEVEKISSIFMEKFNQINKTEFT